MALSPKLKICFNDNCKELRVQDNTGVYNASTNLGGWGAPNSTLAGADAATLDITLPGATTAITFNVLTTVNAASIVDSLFLIDDYKMDDDFSGTSGQKFPDGVYKFVYTITDTGTDYVQTITTFSTCQAQCCVDKLLAAFHKDLCGCNSEQAWDNWKKASMLLENARYAFGCNDSTTATALLTAVNNICDATDCSC